MARIDEELKAAQAAKAVVGALLTRPISTSSAELRKAKTIAVINLGGGGGALNEARADVGVQGRKHADDDRRGSISTRTGLDGHHCQL